MWSSVYYKSAHSESSCEVSNSSCSHQVPQEEFLSTDVMHHLDDNIISYKYLTQNMKKCKKNVSHHLVNILEPSLRPCVWSHSSEASPLGVAYHTQTPPGSPGHTAAKPSPLHWHLVLAAPT